MSETTTPHVEHRERSHKKGSAKTGRTHPTARKIFGTVAIIVIFLALVIVYVTRDKASPPPTAGVTATEVPWCAPERIIAGTTPATLNLTSTVKMRAEGPVDVRYADEATIVHHTSGQGRQVAPVPKGTKKSFVDPRDPEGGHVNFWLCPID